MEFKKELTMEQYIGLIDLGLVDVEDKDIETCEDLFAHEYLSEEDALFFEWKAEQAATRASLIEKNRKAKRRKESFKAEHKVPKGLLYKVSKDTDRDFYISKKKAQKWSHETKVALANKARNYIVDNEYDDMVGTTPNCHIFEAYTDYEKRAEENYYDVVYGKNDSSIDAYFEAMESLKTMGMYYASLNLAESIIRDVFEWEYGPNREENIFDFISMLEKHLRTMARTHFKSNT